MAEPEKKLGNPISTEGFPIVYSNLASMTANYSDVRIYFADAQANTIVTQPIPGQQPVVSEANIAPRICLVLTPEFARTLRDALAQTLSLYEAQFGALRPVPQSPSTAAPARQP
jgi:hypothetical protein